MYSLSAFFVHECLPRHYSGKDCDPNNQFHLSGNCMYVQAVSRSVRQNGETTLWKTFTAFHYINEMHWCACCDFRTALQTTSLTVQTPDQPYKWPTKVHYMSKLWLHTLFSAATHPQDGCLQQPQSGRVQNGHQSNAHQRCLHVANGAANCNTVYGTGQRRLITSSFKIIMPSCTYVVY